MEPPVNRRLGFEAVPNLTIAFIFVLMSIHGLSQDIHPVP